jgi:uncharacterized protein YndB with AHSA1/START domain
MDKIIQHSVRLHCNTHRAFEMFTVNKYLQTWLTAIADVEPAVGGKYELIWDPSDRENNNTIGCRVTAIERDKYLAFEWKGPKRFKHFMNNADPLTHVTVLFIPSDEVFITSTDVYLIHSGWRSSPEWEEARRWFVRAWSEAFEELESQVNG